MPHLVTVWCRRVCRLATTRVSLSSHSTLLYWVMFHTSSLLYDHAK